MQINYILFYLKPYYFFWYPVYIQTLFAIIPPINPSFRLEEVKGGFSGSKRAV